MKIIKDKDYGQIISATDLEETRSNINGIFKQGRTAFVGSGRVVGAVNKPFVGTSDGAAPIAYGRIVGLKEIFLMVHGSDTTGLLCCNVRLMQAAQEIEFQIGKVIILTVRTASTGASREVVCPVGQSRFIIYPFYTTGFIGMPAIDSVGTIRGNVFLNNDPGGYTSPGIYTDWTGVFDLHIYTGKNC